MAPRACRFSCSKHARAPPDLEALRVRHEGVEESVGALADRERDAARRVAARATNSGGGGGVAGWVGLVAW